jgi:cytochrome c oxidase subunit 4
MMTDNKQKHHHILPLKTYLIIGAALLVLTVITVTVAQINLGPYNLVVALSIATIKAVLVAFFFMHLLYDNKLYLLIYTSALFFLGVFIIFTLFDTMRRGDLYQDIAVPIEEKAVIYETVPADSAEIHQTDDH